MVQEGDLVLCTVERIEHTTVFVTLPSGEQGTMVLSEIAPGRIKNLREYVMPNKKVVCKVIRISGKNIDLSLRRVSTKEKSEVMEKYKQEQTAKSALNQILKEKAKETQEKILKEMSLSEFFSRAKEDESLIVKFIAKEFHEVIKKITQKKKKGVEVKASLQLKCMEPDGVSRIKKILETKDANITISYLSAGNFQITVKSENYKDANKKLDSFLQNSESLAKKQNCEFEVTNK